MHQRKFDRDATGGVAKGTPALAEEAHPGDLDACVRLFEWVRSNGGVTAPVAVTSEGGMRRLVAAKDIARGSHAVDMPTSLVLTLEVATTSRAGRALASIADRLHPRSILATHLIFARRDRSFPCCHVDALPPSMADHPVLCSDEHFRALAGTSAGDITLLLKATLREDHRRISECLASVDRVACDEFGWAFCNVLSRTFNAKFEAGDRRTALTPVIDLMNCSARPNCAMAISGDRVRAEALRDIACGEELTLSYGDHSNATLLAIWGFCLEDEAFDRAAIAVPAATPALIRSTLESKRSSAALRVWGGTIGPTFASTDSQTMLAFLRSRQSNPFEDQWPAGARLDDFATPRSRSQEMGAMRDLLAACHAQAESIRARASTCVPGVDDHPLARASARATQGELRVLAHFIDVADHAIATLAIDDPEAARATLPGMPDDGYADALRASWDLLWPLEATRTTPA